MLHFCDEAVRWLSGGLSSAFGEAPVLVLSAAIRVKSGINFFSCSLAVDPGLAGEPELFRFHAPSSTQGHSVDTDSLHSALQYMQWDET